VASLDFVLADVSGIVSFPVVLSSRSALIALHGERSVCVILVLLMIFFYFYARLVGVITRCLGLEDGRSIFAAGVGIHPSIQPEQVAAGGTTPTKLMERTQNKPILFLPAKEDDLKTSSPIIQRLAKRRALRVNDISVEFPTVSHGFVSRGPFLVGEYKEAQEKAIQVTVTFLEQHLEV
jgi:hypothetical protein